MHQSLWVSGTVSPSEPLAYSSFCGNCYLSWTSCELLTSNLYCKRHTKFGRNNGGSWCSHSAVAGHVCNTYKGTWVLCWEAWDDSVNRRRRSSFSMVSIASKTWISGVVRSQVSCTEGFFGAMQFHGPLLPPCCAVGWHGAGPLIEVCLSLEGRLQALQTVNPFVAAGPN